MHKLFSVTVAIILSLPGYTQSKYNPAETFAPGLYTNKGNTIRSANGAPGPAYWQNRADYNLQAAIDTAKQQLTGYAIIRYTNNSPDSLNSLWLLLEQNIYKKGARGNFLFDQQPQEFTSGFEIDEVKIGQGTATTVANYI
ncbi:MAG TPA: M1 family peptidase, partial [Niastella sp.]